MRRLTAVVLLVAVTACSGGDDDATPDATTTTTSTTAVADDAEATTAEPSTTTTTSSTTTTTTTELARYEPEPTPLPGLLDDTPGEIADDADVRTGVLDNGLTYYVRRNGSPLGRTSLRLAIRAGSVDEFGESTGVAHFVEHMLFNGTEDYPENELIDLLQSFGADFGPHVNAYTSFDETVYMLTVPSESEPVRTALGVMEQWLSAATITDADVEAERGVMLDEWRIRNETRSGRQNAHTFDMFLGDTPYGDRWVGGDDTSIENVPTAELREFYEAWYRPDNAAIVVVGDIDPGSAVRWITDTFDPVPAPTDDLRPAVDHRFDIDTEPEIGVHLDPDEDTASIEVTLPVPAHEGSPREMLRLSLVDEMIQDILVRRLEGDLYDGVAPFTAVWNASNNWVPQLDATALWVDADPSDAAASLEAVLLEYRRVYEHGFHEAEVDTARESIVARLDNEYAGRDTVRDEDWAEALVEHFLTGTPYPNIETVHPVAVAEAAVIDADALHERFMARYSNSAPHVLVFAPEDSAADVPTADEVMDAIVTISHADTDQRPVPGELPDQLMDPPEAIDAAASRFVTSPGDNRYSYQQYTYPNGVRLRVISNRQNAGYVIVAAASPGGLAHVPDDDVVDAVYAAEIALASGVGPFNQAEVDTILADTDFSVWAWSDFYSDALFAETSTSELADTFQYIHLLMSQPQFSEVALDQTIARTQPLVDDPTIDPDTARYDLLNELRYGDEPRFATIPTPEQFATLDLDGAARTWDERFGDASDWLFVVYGDVGLFEVRDLGEVYLATLPAGDGEGEPFVTPPAPIVGISEGTVRAGDGQTAATTYYFTTPVPEVTAQLRAEADLASQVVSSRLTAVLREEFGETYSPWVEVWFASEPTPFVEANIDITAAPDGIDRVEQLLLAELADLATNGPGADELELARSVVAELYGWKGPSGIARDLLNADLFDGIEVDDYIVTSRRSYEDWNVSAADVRDFVAAYLPTDRHVNAVSLPR